MKLVKNILYYGAIYFISFVLFAFATSKFFNFQFQIYNFTLYKPLKELSSFSVAWSFFGHSYTYNVFLGLIEFLAAVLILFDRTRLAGLLIAAGIYVNIFIVDIEFEIKDAVVHASIEFLIVLLLLIPYLKHLKKFFWDMGGKFNTPYPASGGRKKIIVAILFIAAVCIALTLSLFNLKSSQSPVIGAYQIKTLTINKDSVATRGGEFTKYAMQFFEFGNTYILSLNDSTYYGTYTLNGNRINISMKRGNPFFKSVEGTIFEDKGLIVGTTEHRGDFKMSFIRINPKNQNPNK